MSESEKLTGRNKERGRKCVCVCVRRRENTVE